MSASIGSYVDFLTASDVRVATLGGESTHPRLSVGQVGGSTHLVMWPAGATTEDQYRELGRIVRRVDTQLRAAARARRRELREARFHQALDRTASA